MARFQELAAVPSLALLIFFIPPEYALAQGATDYSQQTYGLQDGASPQDMCSICKCCVRKPDSLSNLSIESFSANSSKRNLMIFRVENIEAITRERSAPDGRPNTSTTPEDMLLQSFLDGLDFCSECGCCEIKGGEIVVDPRHIPEANWQGAGSYRILTGE